ncbi:hypothetical protein ES703_38134 [subsurface metagenome]
MRRVPGKGALLFDDISFVVGLSEKTVLAK